MKKIAFNETVACICTLTSTRMTTGDYFGFQYENYLKKTTIFLFVHFNMKQETKKQETADEFPKLQVTDRRTYTYTSVCHAVCM